MSAGDDAWSLASWRSSPGCLVSAGDDAALVEPTDAELVAEGWEQFGDERVPVEWTRAHAPWTWLHVPSRRSVAVRRSNGWTATVRRHDEEGNPAHEMHTLFSCGGNRSECRSQWARVGPFPTFDEAMRFARGMRRSILAEAIDASTAEQLALFPDSGTGVGT